MSSEEFGAALALIDEYARIESELASPEIHSDPVKSRQLGRRYAQLGPIVAGYRAWRIALDDLRTAQELAVEDESCKIEIPQLEFVCNNAASGRPLIRLSNLE